VRRAWNGRSYEGIEHWRIRNSTQELPALVDNPKGDADDVASMV